MLEPKLFAENLFDDWMDFFPWTKNASEVERKLYGKHASKEMLTDVKEHEDHYEVEIDLPGFKKDEITLKLENGCLTVTAAKGLDKGEKDKEGKVIRQERYAGVLSRSFYVGENIGAEMIKAKFEDGVLRLEVPKNVAEIENKNTIMIE